MPLEQFEELSPTEKAYWQNDPYFACLQFTIELAINMAAESSDPAENIQIVCDQQPQLEAKANRIYRACKDQLPNGNLLRAFTFASSKDFPGLQVADLIAYEGLQLRRDMLDPAQNVIDDMRWPMQQLCNKTMVDFEFFTAVKLRELKPVRL